MSVRHETIGTVIRQLDALRESARKTEEMPCNRGRVAWLSQGEVRAYENAIRLLWMAQHEG